MKTELETLKIKLKSKIDDMGNPLNDFEKGFKEAFTRVYNEILLMQLGSNELETFIKNYGKDKIN